jgi:hypothetical protein
MFDGFESIVNDICGIGVLEMEWFTYCYKGKPGRVEIITVWKEDTN